MSRKFAEFVIKKRWLLLTLIIFVTAFFLYEIATKLTTYTIFSDLLPQKHPYVQLHNRVRQQFGGANAVAIGVHVKDGTIYNEETLTKIIQINEEMTFCPGVDRYKVLSIGARKIKDTRAGAGGIESPPLMWPTAPKTPEEMNRLKKAIFSNDLYYGTFVAIDGSAALIMADFFEEKIDYKAIYQELERIRAKYEDDNHIVTMVGTPVLLGAVKSAMGQTFNIFIVTMIAIILMLSYYFRSKRGVILPIFAALLSGTWGVGYMALLKLNLDPVMMVLPVLISAMAISHVVQVIKRFNEEYTEEKGVKETCIQVIEKLLVPNMTGIITDAYGIFLIAICPIPILQKFGIICGFWALQTLVISIIFGPIALSFFNPPKVKPEKTTLLDKILSLTDHFAVGRLRWLTVAAVVVICILCGLKASTVYFGDVHEGSSILWPDSRYNRDAKLLDGPFSGLQNPMLVVLEGQGEAKSGNIVRPATTAAEASNVGKSTLMSEASTEQRKRTICYPNIMRMAEAFQRRMVQIPEVGASESFVDLQKRVNMLLHTQDPKWSVVPTDYISGNQFLFLIVNAGQPGDFDRYYTYDKQAMSLMIYVKDHKGNTIRNVLSEAKRIIKDLYKEFPNDLQATFKLAGGTIGVEGATNEVLQSSQGKCFALALAGVFIFCMISFRSVTAGFILFIPIVISNTICFAFMAWKLIGITVSTFPVFSVGVGLGVDYGIYLVGRIRDECRNGNTLDDAIRIAISTTGKAVIYIATTLTLGVVFWFFSDLMFQANMGLLLGFVMILNMLGALLVIPAVLSLMKPKFLVKHV